MCSIPADRAAVHTGGVQQSTSSYDKARIRSPLPSSIVGKFYPGPSNRFEPQRKHGNEVHGVPNSRSAVTGREQADISSHRSRPVLESIDFWTD
ncbi:hypothetical protein M430DRAFT_18223 [Amorphotheca resinae ATCC 22711]|uniref:Uncharacterized protein n=1 Tax=Amorphotheca resinae ATCC 22711 TaxID=857342 RepID=A0A2T3B344_AMORE|nr:hypothetical protein M430DRAFT_18223 [Amorphotheca resinae ATCC 22711]PSS20041.1 hypothetical protein M430DRAFT_18223 [Amorphotheca resinae ATCC 22711]